MKRFLHVMLMLVITAGACLAQPGGQRFSPEKFRADLERYITKEVGFTQSEAREFYPLYHEMKDKQRDLQHKVFELKKNMRPYASEKEFTNAVLRITSLNRQKAELEETYYKKMCKAVPAKKVYEAMLAEDRFHRQMLNRMDHHNQHKKRR